MLQVIPKVYPTLSDKSVKKRFSVTLTGPYVEALDSLVDKGLYLDQQDAIRGSLRRLRRHHGIDPFRSELVAEVQE